MAGINFEPGYVTGTKVYSLVVMSCLSSSHTKVDTLVQSSPMKKH